MNDKLTDIAKTILLAHLCAEKQNEPIEEWLDLDQLTDDIRAALSPADIAQVEASADKLTNFSDIKES
jgi:hypothetical protein